MTYFILLLMTGILPSTVEAEALHIPFYAIEKRAPELQRQVIRIRGFLYCAEDGRVLLASVPNIKSCCLSKTPTIELIGMDISSSVAGEALEVEGTFYSDSTGFHLEKVQK